MIYVYDSYSSVGGRENNEDAHIEVDQGNRYLYVVADGLGGHDCGEVASNIAVNEIKRQFESEQYFDLEKAIISANEMILNKQQETGLKMRTTVVAAYVNNDVTVFANVGDSRVYAFDESSIIFQSLDHSASQMAVKIGKINQSEIRNHSDRNVLTRALGASDSLKVDVNKVNSSDYQRLLLCTDGFWEYVLEEEMIETLLTSKFPDAWLFKMREKHTQRIPKNNDNNTAIAVIRKENLK